MFSGFSVVGFIIVGESFIYVDSASDCVTDCFAVVLVSMMNNSRLLKRTET